MHVAIILFDGFDNLDAIGPFEVFNHANRFGAEIDVGLYTLDPQDVVTSGHGLRIVPDGELPTATGQSHAAAGGADSETDNPPDLVLVPGGGWQSRASDGTRAEAERGDIPEALAAMHGAGVTVASVCSGGMLLATAGLTDGRPAVTHHGAMADLRESGAEVVEARVVDDGDLLTAGGITAGIDLALHLLEREFDPEVAEEVASVMEYERQGEVSVSDT